MTQPIDPERLRTEQYHNAQKLSARIAVHARFSTATQDLHEWFFDRLLRLNPEDAALLEIGCGRGDVWHKNAERIPQGWQITLTDFSPGMLADCQAHLGSELAGHFTFREMNAQDIPYPDAHFDGVIANYMLYHVPDRAQAIAEMRRVLKPGGYLLAMTNGAQHMAELMALGEKYLPELAAERDRDGFITGNFSLENGETQLRAQFANVQLERFPDSLFVTEAQPLLDYIESMMRLPGQALIAQHGSSIRAEVEGQIAASGGFRITKATGLFVAS
jgi:SAM-dependent methyltransferase